MRQSVTVAPDTDYSDKDFYLGSGATISGVAYDNKGNTLSGDYIYAYTGAPCSEPVFIAGARISSDGSYTIAGLSDGACYLKTNIIAYPDLNEWWAGSASSKECLQAQGIPVAPQEAITGKDFQLDHIVISGTVYDNAENPVTDGTLKVYTGAPCNSTTLVDTVSLNSEGKYTTQHLSPGNYYLAAAHNESHYDDWWANSASSRDCSGAQAVTVTSEESVVGINFQLDAKVTIFGTVFDDLGAPITGGRVYIYTGNPCSGKTRIAIVTIDSNGNYRSEVLPAGDYFLLATASNQPNFLFDEWWADPASSQDCAEAQTVTVGLTEMAVGTDFQLDRASSISGTVYDQKTNTPLSGGYVRAYTGDRSINSAVHLQYPLCLFMFFAYIFVYICF